MAKGGDELRSSIPSRMKRRMKLKVSPGETLVVKQHIVVFTNQPSQNLNGEKEPIQDRGSNNQQ